VSKNYAIVGIELKSEPPHKFNPLIWKQRPLTPECIEYAAIDVHIIKHLWYEMSKTKVSDILMQRTIKGCRQYESIFRDHPEKVNFSRDKDFIMEEHAIINESELPKYHPRRMKESECFKVEKWNRAIHALESRLPSAFSHVLYILQHDEWYTDEGLREIKRLAANYPFTKHQQHRISSPK